MFTRPSLKAHGSAVAHTTGQTLSSMEPLAGMRPLRFVTQPGHPETFSADETAGENE